MDFFGRQNAVRRGSRWLIGGFVLAMLVMALAVHLVVSGVGVLLGESPDLLSPSVPAKVLIGLVWSTVVFGAFFRWLDVRAGGAALARRFGAVELGSDHRDERIDVLRNVIAEVAIASGCRSPQVFLLRRESAINAFVVASARDDVATLVLTEGALDALDRNELRAVVAHEIAHVMQGDLPLNMRLMMVMSGLAALDEVGRLVIGDRHGDGLRHRFIPLLIIGFVLRALGSIGVLIGGIIRAAVSRQREFLADATAVQYVRQPFALAAALVVIRDAHEATALHSHRIEEVAHLCFQNGQDRPWYRRLLASHPPLQARIDAIDPHIDVKLRKRRASKPEDATAAVATAGTGGATNMPEGGSRLLPFADQTAATSADVNGSGISDRILLMLPDPAHCLGALCAIFAPGDVIKRRDFLGAMTFTFDQHLASRVESILADMKGELVADRLHIIEHASSVLRETVNQDNRLRLLVKLEKLLESRGELDLAGYSTLQLVRRKLDVEFPLLENIANSDRSLADGRQIKTFDAMGDEFALLLSLMVESSGASETVLEREFARVLKCYTQTPMPRRSKREQGIVSELEKAFQTLYVQPKPIRRAFVQHCREIMEADGHIAPAELSLLGLFAASLGCEELAA